VVTKVDQSSASPSVRGIRRPLPRARVSGADADEHHGDSIELQLPGETSPSSRSTA